MPIVVETEQHGCGWTLRQAAGLAVSLYPKTTICQGRLGTNAKKETDKRRFPHRSKIAKDFHSNRVFLCTRFLALAASAEALNDAGAARIAKRVVGDRSCCGLLEGCQCISGELWLWLWFCIFDVVLRGTDGRSKRVCVGASVLAPFVL